MGRVGTNEKIIRATLDKDVRWSRNQREAIEGQDPAEHTEHTFEPLKTWVCI